MNYLEKQQETYYAERIGKQYGCFQVVKVEWDSVKKKQKWIMKCVYCGSERITYNGRDYVKGKNAGTCQCVMKQRRNEQKEQTRMRHEAEKEKIRIEREKINEEKRERRIIKEKLRQKFHLMEERCYNKNHKSYCTYGAKGITICDEWLNDFDNFYQWAMDSGYECGLTIDRIDNNKGYSPDNCRWMTKADQNRNKTNVKLYYGKTCPQIAEEFGINENALRHKLSEGFPIENAVMFVQMKKYMHEHNMKIKEEIERKKEPNQNTDVIYRKMQDGKTLEEALCFEGKKKKITIDGETLTKKEWCERFGITEPAVAYRMKVKGMSFEEALTTEKYHV